MSTVVLLLVVAGILLMFARQSNLKSKPVFEPNPNTNEPDVFANDSPDLDPESDTGEPEGWN